MYKIKWHLPINRICKYPVMNARAESMDFQVCSSERKMTFVVNASLNPNKYAVIGISVPYFDTLENLCM